MFHKSRSKALMSCLPAVVAALSLTTPVGATANAVARWQIFDSGGAPDTCSIVHDVQNNYDGTPQNSCSAGTNFSSSNPRNSGSGTSYNVNGSNFILGNIQGMLPDDDSTQSYAAYTGSRTITAWLYVTGDPSHDKGIVYLGRDSGGGGSACSGSGGASCSGFHLIFTTAGEIGYGTAQGGVVTTDLAGCEIDLYNEDWHFLVGIYSADANNEGNQDDTWIYVDNVLCGNANMATEPFTDIGSGGRFALGSTVNSAGTSDSSSIHRLDGLIDDARVFDRTMGSVERTALWNASSNGGAD